MLLAHIDRDRAFSDYRDAMGAMAETNGRSVLWWATDFASKNRVASPAPAILHGLAILAGALQEPGRTALAVVDAPWPVIAAARAHARLRVEGVSGFTLRMKSLAARLRLIMATLRGGVSAARTAMAARRFYGPAPALDGPTHLLKTFSYPSAFSGDGDFHDPFLGSLRRFLEAGGRRVLTVAAPLAERTSQFAAMRRVVTTNCAPVERHWTALEAAVAAIRLSARLVVGFRTPPGLTFLGGDLSVAFRCALQGAGGRMPVHQYLHYAAGRRLARRHALRRVTMTWEANPWERMFVAGLRSVRPDLPIDGHQHSVTPPAAAGMFPDFRQKTASPWPDRVLTVGEPNAELIARLSDPPRWAQAACALRYRYDPHVAEPEQCDGPLRVFAPLEGLHEAIDLVDYVYAQAPLSPDVAFRFRSHPALPFTAIVAARALGPAPANVTHSVHTAVRDDVLDSDVVLYWGTTVAVEAMAFGKPLIHFDRGDLFSFDPVHDFRANKWLVRRGAPLADTLSAIFDAPAALKAERAQASVDYARRFFAPANDEAMAMFDPEDAAT
ncbi:MAG: hypothetical protein AAF360_01045 [Pseudomonadota bacterium]